MQFSDLVNDNRIQRHCDATEYENTRISNVCVKPGIDINTTDLQKTENNYEQLRLETKQNEGGTVRKENKRDKIRWKDLPKEIKYIIYTLSVMLVILYIIGITAVVVLSLPKGEKADSVWTHWSPWSNCDVTCNNGTQTRTRLCMNPSKSDVELDCFGDSSDLRYCQQISCPSDGAWTHWSPWSNCGVTCNNGIQTRTRLCTNPLKLNKGPDCFGDSTDTRHCQKRSCNDYGVAFTANRLDTDVESKSVLRFQNARLNKGGAYNSTTGVFTCIIPGVYYFAITLTKSPKDAGIVVVVLIVKGTNTLYMYHYPGNYGTRESYTMTATGSYHLNINDTVYLRGEANQFITGYSSFTGFLVLPDV